MTLFWFGVGCGLAGISLIVWAILRAGSTCDDWIDAYGPLGPAFTPTQAQRMGGPVVFDQDKDMDWWISRLRQEIRELPQTEERT